MYETERAELVAAGRRLAGGGLVVGTAGNLSRLVWPHVLVTGSGTRLGALTPDDIVVVARDGTVVHGDLPPTSELPLHLAIYRETDAGAIAHAHASASVAVGLDMTSGLPPIHYMTMLLGGPVRIAPYATFGSTELAESVVHALRDRTAALMEHHGSVAYASTADQACERLELLEWLAETYVKAKSVTQHPKKLSKRQLRVAAEEFASRGYGRAPS